MDKLFKTNGPEITLISWADATRVSGGRMKQIGPAVPTVGQPGEGWTWATSVTELPANEGVGIVVHF
jgi:hypothetical protein